MPNFTPNFALPYPSATDEPCDFADQWCQFTAAVDAVFDRFQATLDRTVPVIPMAIMKISQSVTVPSFGFMPFDTVVIDNAGWTAPDLDPTMISPNMAAVLTFHSDGMFVQQANPGSFLIDVNDSSGVLTQPLGIRYENTFDNNTFPPGADVEQMVLFSPGHWIPGISGLRNIMGNSSGTPIIMRYANFTIYWHADGGTV